MEELLLLTQLPAHELIEKSIDNIRWALTLNAILAEKNLPDGILYELQQTAVTLTEALGDLRVIKIQEEVTRRQDELQRQSTTEEQL